MRDLPGEDAEMIPDERLGLVFACCHPALAHGRPGPAHAAAGRRVDGARDRPRAAAARGDGGAADRAREAQGALVRDPDRRAGARRAGGPAAPRSSPSSTSCSTRATPRPRATPCCATDLAAEAIRLARVVHAPAPGGARARRAARADAARTTRAAPRRAGRTASSCCWRSRTARAGTAPRSPGAAARRPRADASAARPARTRCRPRSPLSTRRRAAPRPPTGGRSPLLYAELGRVQPGPVVALNQAVAVAMADGPADGPRPDRRACPRRALDRYHLLHAARADLLRATGRRAEAAGGLRPRARAGDAPGGAALPRAPARACGRLNRG